MTVAGLIFSNLHDSDMPELTGKRALASVPFGCRYRLIDFALSNMVNSDIIKVGIITHNNYQSLVDHIGTGKDWDLARRSGGIKILSPFITAYDTQLSGVGRNTMLESLIGVSNFISRCSEDLIVLCDCDGVCNIDISEVLRFHEKRNADFTIVTAKEKFEQFENTHSVYSVSYDDNNNITDVYKLLDKGSEATISTNVIVANRRLLLNLINNATARGYTDFYRDIIKKSIGVYNVCAYEYTGRYILVNSLRSYFDASMKLLSPEVRRDILGVYNRPIYTKVRNSAPTVYTKNASVTNSFVADGCVIEGKVENCIIFRGVKIGKDTVVKNCILLQDTDVGDNVSLNCVITDKNVTIRDGRTLSGYQSTPFFLAKGTEV